MEYYGRDGNPISMNEWMVEWSKDRQIDLTLIKEGCEVSTAWTGLKPQIFETMIFTEDEGMPTYSRRWDTEEEARKGHEEAVAWAKEKLSNPRRSVGVAGFASILPARKGM
jgi:hypothetical protein